MATVVERSAFVVWPASVGPRRLSYRGQWRLLVAALLFVDGLAVLGSLSLAYLVRLSSGLLAYTAHYDPGTYRDFLLLSVPIWLVIFWAMGLYRADGLLGGLSEYTSVLKGCMGGVLAIIVLSFFMRAGPALSRGWLLLAWGFAMLLVLGGRFAVRRIAYALQRRGYLTARALIVGANDQGIAMAEQWLRTATSGMSVVGFLDDFKPLGTRVIDGLEVVGRPSALDAAAHQLAVEEIVIVSGAVAWESVQEILSRPLQRNGYTVRMSPGFYGTLGTGVAVSNKSFVPLLKVSETRLAGLEVVLKSAVDYALALAFALVALPAMVVIAACLKRAAPRQPVFIQYSTLGLRKAPFAMLKFRARPAGSALEARLLASGFDKLPQIFNVLRGEMSLVGPRPRAAAASGDNTGAEQNVHTVKPGIIGPWTIDAVWLSGNEKQDELWYIRNWTVWLDLQVIFQTLLPWLRRGRSRHALSDRGAQSSGLMEK